MYWLSCKCIFLMCYYNFVVNKMNKVTLPEGYAPSNEDEYMCSLHLEYFRQKLNNWKEEILTEHEETLRHLKETHLGQSDINDQAAIETEASVELKHTTRKLKLISKINEALERIKTSEYGYCEETGEPIGLQRLMARPIATLSIEAQEMHEKKEKQYSKIPQASDEDE